MQIFRFVNRGSKLDLKEICDGLSWKPSQFGRSRPPKARQCDLKVGFVRRNFSESEIFHGTLGFGRGRLPPVCLSQPDVSGCENSEVRWDKVMTFSHISGWQKDFHTKDNPMNWYSVLGVSQLCHGFRLDMLPEAAPHLKYHHDDTLQNLSEVDPRGRNHWSNTIGPALGHATLRGSCWLQ